MRVEQTISVNYGTHIRTFRVRTVPLVEGMILRITPNNDHDTSPIVLISAVNTAMDSVYADLLLFYQVAELPEAKTDGPTRSVVVDQGTSVKPANGQVGPRTIS